MKSAPVICLSHPRLEVDLEIALVHAFEETPSVLVHREKEAKFIVEKNLLFFTLEPY